MVSRQQPEPIPAPDPREVWEDPLFVLDADPDRGYRLVEDLLDHPRRVTFWCDYVRVASSVFASNENTASEPEPWVHPDRPAQVIGAVVSDGVISSIRRGNVRHEEVVALLLDPDLLLETHHEAWLSPYWRGRRAAQSEDSSEQEPLDADEQESLPPSVAVVNQAAGYFVSNGWASRVAQLEGELREELPKLNRCLRQVDVFPGWHTRATQYMSTALWPKRLQELGEQMGLHLASRLAQVFCVGVSWGETITESLRGLKKVLPEPPLRKEGPTVCIATVGGDVGIPNISTDTNSSLLAMELAKILNGDWLQAFTLHGVPALIPHSVNTDHIPIIRNYHGQLENYRTIFGIDGQGGMIEHLEAILTSCGEANRPSLFWKHELKRLKIPHDVFARIAYGDIGGVLLKKPNLSPADEALFHDIERRWTGISPKLYRRFAEYNPGVILIALGESKKDIVLECIQRGLVSELIIDGDLAQGLSDRLAQRRSGDVDSPDELSVDVPTR